MKLDDREFVEELTREAIHNGDTYGFPKMAAEVAFKEFQKRRRKEEREYFKELRKEIQTNLCAYWKRQRDEGNY